MEVVDSEVTFDGQRVVETLEDGTTTQRPVSLAEQAEYSKGEVCDYVVRMLSACTGGEVEVADGGSAGDEVTITLKLTGTAAPADEPAPAPQKASRKKADADDEKSSGPQTTSGTRSA